MQKKRTIFFASIALLAVGASGGRIYADEPKPIKLPIPGPGEKDKSGDLIIEVTKAEKEKQRHVKVTVVYEKKKDTKAQKPKVLIDKDEDVSYTPEADGNGEAVWNLIHVYCPSDDKQEKQKKPKDRKPPFVKYDSDQSAVLPADEEEQTKIKKQLKELFGEPK
jgi:biopolymer transport protein ExbD